MHVLRAVALALFALTLVLQPVMAAVGEMHELAHDPSGTHSHVLHAPDAGTAAEAADRDDHEATDMVHLMLHFAHCCAATAAVLPTPTPSIGMPLRERLAAAKAAFPAQMRLTSPFKPPISV